MQDFGSIPSLEYVGYDDLKSQGVVTRGDLINKARQRSSQNQRLKNYEGMADTASQYSYAGKSKVIYQRGLNKRATTQSRGSYRQLGIGPHEGGADTKSQLSKQNVQRFNENFKDGGALKS